MYELKRRSLFLSAMAAAVASTGCGGGQGGGPSSTGQAHVVKSGNAVITYFGQPKPLVTATSSSVSVLGQAGATFSAVTLEPPPGLADTYLVFGRQAAAGATVLEEVPYAGGSPAPIYQNDGTNINPAISAYGTIAFQQNQTIQSVRADGTGLKAISFTGPTAFEYPAYSVDGTNRLAFYGYMGSGWSVFVGPGTGGAPTLLQSSSVNVAMDLFGLAWNPAGTQLAFVGVPSGQVSPNIFSSGTAAGTTPVNITPPAYRNSQAFFNPCWSSDGVTVACNAEPPGSISSVATFNIATQSLQILTPSGDSDGNCCFSPDGSKIAFYRSNSGGATPGIYMCDTDGENQQLMYADAAGTSSFDGIAWSPYLPKETVVATSGSTFYHQPASGILLSQNGSQFGSMVAFTAATPSTAAIQTPSTTTGYAPLQFTITADSITSIGYANGYFSPGTTISLTSTPTAVVSIDAINGQVDLVAPLSVAKPALLKNSDGTVTYKGSFKALYDGKGKNLASSGASTVTVNPKTGHLVSWS